MNDEIFYTIALSLVPNVGPITGKKLIKTIGSAYSIFKESKKNLSKIKYINNNIIECFNSAEIFKRVEKEIDFMEHNGIRALTYLDDNYPPKLKACFDSPLLLYIKGNYLPNKSKILAIVGTRNANSYGIKMCEKIISEIKEYDIGVVSGLAYGIDTEAHNNCLKYNLSTYAVLGNGLHTIYPEHNVNLAQKITINGCLISEFISGTKPDRENFPQRNRIIAGLSDAVLVVEAAEKGGALITADIAHSYNRDIFTIPGRIDDKYSSGCNLLIKKQQASMVLSGLDIIENMNWDNRLNSPLLSFQTTLFTNINPIQEDIINYIKKNQNSDIDKISEFLNIPIYKLTSLLLDLELQGIINCLPGKIYRTN